MYINHFISLPVTAAQLVERADAVVHRVVAGRALFLLVQRGQLLHVLLGAVAQAGQVLFAVPARLPARVGDGKVDQRHFGFAILSLEEMLVLVDDY